jgi:phosphonate transport system substrate-binding protein
VATIAAAPIAASAASWQDKYKELVFAVVPAENAQGVTERFGPFADYLSKELKTKVTLRIASDYAAVIEGQKAGNIHIAWYGPASYARAWKVSNGGVEVFAAPQNETGLIGYYAVIYVKASSPYKTIADLKGKALGMVDPNSTSGSLAPRFFLNEEGKDVDSFFGKVVMTGSHENAIIALGNGTVDAATNWWNAENDSNLTRMASKGMAKTEDFRVIWKTPVLPGSPYAWLKSLPQDAKNDIRKAFIDAPVKAKAVFDKLSDGKDRGNAPVEHGDYAATVKMMDFIDDLRKKKSS